MTVNINTGLYDRLAADIDIPRHKVKKLLYRLAYDGEMQTVPTGPEEFILRGGLQIAQRGLATKELADWLLKYSLPVARERAEYQPRAAYEIARDLIEGAQGRDELSKDRASLMHQVASLRNALDEIREAVDEALKIGGA